MKKVARLRVAGRGELKRELHQTREILKTQEAIIMILLARCGGQQSMSIEAIEGAWTQCSLGKQPTPDGQAVTFKLLPAKEQSALLGADGKPIGPKASLYVPSLQP